MLNLAEEEELPVDKYPVYHIYHGPRTTGRKHNDMNAAKQGGNGGSWGMKGQAAPAVLCQGGCCAPAPRQGAPARRSMPPTARASTYIRLAME
jgi:hypothetical protein